jgi:hypothetical protein
MSQYAINGIVLSAQPTTGQWVDREPIGITGNGHGVYPALRSFQITFDYITAAQFNEIYNLFSNNNITGTVVATLPKYADSSYTFFAYSGCVLREPSFSEYFEEHYSDVGLLIVRIQV